MTNRLNQSDFVLGIETSCDETGVAIYSPQQGIVAEALYSQIATHAEFGGVVPELASRDHIRKLAPLTREVLDKAQLKSSDIAAVAYTAGPGLVGALMVGAGFGRSLAQAWGIPAVGVHHMEGHLLAPLLEDDAPAFPFIALLVSGGHTLLVQVSGIGEYEILGESLDDAVGEAFDKTAKRLGLPYPGGPQLARLAEQGDASRFDFPRPLTRQPGLDFSFSGLKTHVVNLCRKLDLDSDPSNEPQTRADIAAGFQLAVVETLAIKCRRALEHTGLERLIVAGGVGANLALRVALTELTDSRGARVYYPRPEYCTDNGAMIACAGWHRWQAGQFEGLAMNVRPRWSLEDLAVA